jgi:putative DNA primase/helicase
MSIDLNNARRYGVFDVDVIEEALRRHANKWVPLVFPNGRREPEAEGIGWRVADISGRAPRRLGSCRIWLTGEHVGEWYEFEGNHGGQILSTIKEHYQLADGEVIFKAIELLEKVNCNFTDIEVKPKTNGHDTRKDAKGLAAAADFWSQAKPLPGTIGETYWHNRGLGDLPPAAFGDDPDMKFIDFATNWDLGAKGTPAIINRFRYPNGELTNAIHLIHLCNDGSWHIGKEYPDRKGIAKKSWGPRIDGGLAMLASIGADGALGIGEGIESTAAGMRLFGVPGWAACGTAAMRKFGEWIAAADPASLPIKRLLLWGDAGKGGERTLFETAALCRSRLAQVECYLPATGDDLAADLAAGHGAPGQVIEPEPGLPIGPQATPLGAPLAVPGDPTRAEIDSRLMALGKASAPADVTTLCHLLARADMPPIERESAINTIYRKAGISKKTVAETIRKLRADAEIIEPTLNHEKKGKRHWLDKLALGNDGDPKGIMSNVATVLREAEEIKSCFAFNEFTGMIHIMRKLPWEAGAGNPCKDRWMDDQDELGTYEWVQATAGIHATRGVVFDAIQRVASENKYHPAREYLNDVFERWDRRARLDMAAVLYFGARDSQYNREVFKRWIISGVSRIFNPGCKADNMMVFEGPQGLGKSTAIRILFDPLEAGWFTDQLSEINTKDASIELRGIWCAEYAELDRLGKAETSTIKSFMSRTTDRYRPPYGRLPIRVERQNLFAGTVNEYEWQKDATGARRFWPLRCIAIDRGGLIRDRDLLWGEAVHMFRQSVSFWIDEIKEPELAAEAARVVDTRYVGDAWDSVVKRWLQNNARVNVTADELLRDALEIHDRAKWSRNDQARVGYIMRRMKWQRARDRQQPREWRYWRPGTLNPAIAEAEED